MRENAQAVQSTTCGVKLCVRIDTGYVYTYYVEVNITLSVDDEVIREARRLADAMGTSVNQLVRDYLAQLAGQSDRASDAEAFRQLSLAAHGNSEGWKFNREEIHEREGDRKREEHRKREEN